MERETSCLGSIARYKEGNIINTYIYIMGSPQITVITMTTMTTIISGWFYDPSPRNGVYPIRKYTLCIIIVYNTYNVKK